MSSDRENQSAELSSPIKEDFRLKSAKLLGSIVAAGLVALLLLGVAAVLPTSPDGDLLDVLEAQLKRHASKVKNRRQAILVDFDRPTFRKRLWVVDLKTREVLLNTHVSHALLSGLVYASDFSNVRNSCKSAPGSYVTAGAYTGKFGYSRRLKGLERGKNHNALARSIILHKSWAPWSAGCLMTRPADHKQLMAWTKSATLVHVHVAASNWLGKRSARLWAKLPVRKLICD